MNAELERVGDSQRLADYTSGVIDTLALARRLHPGQRNGLDDLCQRYYINSAARTQHGALLDAQLLAQVYLAMSGGQLRIALNPSAVGAVHKSMFFTGRRALVRQPLLFQRGNQTVIPCCK